MAGTKGFKQLKFSDRLKIEALLKAKHSKKETSTVIGLVFFPEFFQRFVIKSADALFENPYMLIPDDVKIGLYGG